MLHAFAYLHSAKRGWSGDGEKVEKSGAEWSGDGSQGHFAAVESRATAARFVASSQFMSTRLPNLVA